ncbi:E3 ubiquitin-protein ligase dbl4-like [Durio zibethinus]|uniref:RBR-type E3 ubiquitin transferase n=1 Tax=Durio zibethinus TaxID=66656 RepID=A0A6P5WPN8_DURZI|nr:E3 ubiquitin-protein ligase dbl4-like [Durio zibethinus]
MSFINKILFPLRKKKKTDEGKRKQSTPSFCGSSGTCYEAKLIAETQNFLQTKPDCSLNVSRLKRKLHDINSPENNPMKNQKGKEIVVELEELSFPRATSYPQPGESSNTTWFCKICMEPKPASMMFKVTRCNHSFCFACTRRHIATNLKDENKIEVCCPESNCQSLITPKKCKSILPWEVIYRWENTLYYSQTPPILTFDCPLEDCSAKIVDDGKDIGVVQYECPACHRKICAECRDFVHEGMDCDAFKVLVERVMEDAEEEKLDCALLKLAEKENWKRCPNCNDFAGKTEGSNKLECWCKYKYCYDCGSEWSEEHSCFNS